MPLRQHFDRFSPSDYLLRRGESARGLAHSWTLARTMVAPASVKRLGVRAALRRFGSATRILSAKESGARKIGTRETGKVRSSEASTL